MSLKMNVTILLAAILQFGVMRATGVESLPVEAPAGDRVVERRTNWQVEPSFKYDALCLINVLSGDPFYLWHYAKAYTDFFPKLTAEAKAAVANLKRIIKDQGGGIISAQLCLFFSASDDETLDQMIATLDRPETLKDRFARTPYWSEASWDRFMSIRGDLATVLNWYKSIELENHWRVNVRPVAAARAEEMLAEVAAFNIVPLIEQHLGRPLESETITVYMLTYSQPHGIKITGTRFLTDVAWPFQTVVRNAVHEMMHPPYTLAGDAELRAVLDAISKDAFLMNKVENHNPLFGYNTLEGFVEEDCVQALEQLINEQLGIAEDAARRWAKSDDGMHVLAVALYRLMKEEKYPSKDGSIRDFLIRMNHEGRLVEGSVQMHHRAMYTVDKQDDGRTRP